MLGLGLFFLLLVFLTCLMWGETPFWKFAVGITLMTFLPYCFGVLTGKGI